MENVQLNEFIKAKTGDYVVPILEACDLKGEMSEAYPIGYFNQAMRGGIREGELIVITGKSGEGKTTLAQNITKNLDKISIPSLWFSYEVIINNLYAKFKSMNLENELIFVPKVNVSGNLQWIQNKIKEAQEKYLIKTVFIDHIDFISPMVQSDDQRRNILRSVCQELKNMAINLKIMIFLMAHVKKIQGREIEMQDIAESSGIYQIADYVMAIRREQIDENWGGIKTGQNSIKLLKNRPFGEMPSINFEMKNNIIIQI